MVVVVPLGLVVFGGFFIWLWAAHREPVIHEEVVYINRDTPPPRYEQE
jgi:hypothetical protein